MILQKILEADARLFEWILVSLRSEALVHVCDLLVDRRILGLLLLLGIIAGWRKNRNKTIAFALATIALIACSDLIINILKHTFARPRPSEFFGIFFNPHGHSFPSAHAGNSMALAVFFSGWFPEKRKWLIGAAIIVGFARMLARYHFPLDILAGFITGALIGKVVFMTHKVVTSRSTFLQRYFS